MREDRLTRHILLLLSIEREALLDGSYDRLMDIGLRKEVLFAQIGAADLSAGHLRRIGLGAQRNQRLLDAARGGMAAAAERLDALRTTRAGFQAYGREGQRESVSSARPRIERKF